MVMGTRMILQSPPNEFGGYTRCARKKPRKRGLTAVQSAEQFRTARQRSRNENSFVRPWNPGSHFVLNVPCSRFAEYSTFAGNWYGWLLIVTVTGNVSGAFLTVALMSIPAAAHTPAHEPLARRAVNFTSPPVKND